ncbi:hypothetical protein C4577_04470 [Candidatus Parcubacteria bacterium]|nr:MAG: hypothetical protein C4577_04470 [Candidatus Parcubacteria bacterium]
MRGRRLAIIIVLILGLIILLFLYWASQRQDQRLVPGVTVTPTAQPTQAPTATPGAINTPTTTTTPAPTEEQQTTVILAFFPNTSRGGDNCEAVFPVQRMVPETQAVARAALQELLEGPTAQEVQQGYSTSIPSGVQIQSLTIENGTARVDFNEALEMGVGGSCRVAAIRSQIRQTLLHFPTVNNVVISINGRTEDILQP